MGGRMSRNKGQRGEREVCDLLNNVFIAVTGITCAAVDLPFQRNQNQSAVGGDDISCPFPLSIEVKFTETLNVNAWWKQAIESCRRADQRNGKSNVTLLFYRKSRQRWSVVTHGALPLPGGDALGLRVTLTDEAFLLWFKTWLEEYLREEYTLDV